MCLLLLAQATSPDALSLSSVQQRLLELNRQSAAARGRLLDLIEQQKQSVSCKASRSVSPISTSPLSPHITGTVGQPGTSLSDHLQWFKLFLSFSVGGGSPEPSMALPAQELLSQAGGGERR